MNIFAQINKIYFSEYHLAPLKKLNSKSDLNLRKGYLLKFEFKKLGNGYCDLFTWPELGDLQGIKQLENLKAKILNNQLMKCIYFSYLDAKFRSKKENILTKIINPKNHLTVVDFNELNLDFILELKNQGFEKIKIKLGINILEIQQKLTTIFEILCENKIKVRIDFNNTLSKELFELFLNIIRPYLNIIDFIEDPFPEFYKGYFHIKERYLNLNLALDRFTDNQLSSIHEVPVDFYVIKPAVQKLNYSNFQSNLVFTSYMDHPLGQLCALYEAGLFLKKGNIFDNFHCGFLTHSLYEKNKYSETFSIKDSKLIPSGEGTGFGFDEYLQKENWKELI
ncbi:hypothetical protein QEJ31_06690 [Pigmentibacter sp. JX0631]|uniref:hypothetical protein n=1 Tax=Pigmentibacter sp. JX0631 TaxID=2976982 RepID=UPI0024697D4F|nr:hypothetical protein [Pigmentibacter sp. JX0631]WGL61278.1 hypothetical protein QEJ31_06690 [Pigmentibacter sp. JX0631]